MVSVEQLGALTESAWHYLSSSQDKGTIRRLQDLLALSTHDAAFSQTQSQLVVQQLLDRLEIAGTQGLAFGKKLRICLTSLPWLHSELVALTYWLGSMHQRLGDLVQAQTYLQSAIQAMKTATPVGIDKLAVYLEAATVSSSLGQHQKAYACATQAIRLARETLVITGDSSQHLRNLGKAYIQAAHELICLGRPRQSLSLYQTAHRLLAPKQDYPLSDLVAECQRAIQQLARTAHVKTRRLRTRQATPDFNTRFPLEEQPPTFEQLKTKTQARSLLAGRRELSSSPLTPTPSVKRLKLVRGTFRRMESRKKLTPERHSYKVLSPVRSQDGRVLSSLTHDIDGIKYKFMLIDRQGIQVLECLNPKSLRVLWTEVPVGWELEELVQRSTIKARSLEVNFEKQSS